MPVPTPSAVWLSNISAELNQMAILVSAIPNNANAAPPVSSLSIICSSLGSINATLVTSNGAGKMSDAQRHSMANKFQAIANELLK